MIFILEKLGLKAVSAGANPQKLQQAFATAQIKGDWSVLEKEIAGVLGLASINHPEVGNAISANLNKVDAPSVTSSTGGSSESVLPSLPSLPSLPTGKAI